MTPTSIGIGIGVGIKFPAPAQKPKPKPTEPEPTNKEARRDQKSRRAKETVTRNTSTGRGEPVLPVIGDSDDLPE